MLAAKAAFYTFILIIIIAAAVIYFVLRPAAIRAAEACAKLDRENEARERDQQEQERINATYIAKAQAEVDKEHPPLQH